MSTRNKHPLKINDHHTASDRKTTTGQTTRKARLMPVTPVVRNLLDHHLFQNLLHGLRSGCPLQAFPPDDLGRHLRRSFPDDPARTRELLATLPEDVCVFLVRELLLLASFQRELPQAEFQALCDEAYQKLLPLMEKYGAS